MPVVSMGWRGAAQRLAAPTNACGQDERSTVRSSDFG
jgi:hypothetical protein